MTCASTRHSAHGVSESPKMPVCVSGILAQLTDGTEQHEGVTRDGAELNS